MNLPPRIATPLAALALLMSPLPSTAGEADLRAQAEQLATLRGEVEALADELALTKDSLRSDLRAMQSESTDLEARIRREEQRLEGLKLETERLQSETRAAEDASSVLVPVLHTAMAELDARIAAGLPFRVEERREEVKTLKQQLDDALLPPSTVASRLWQLLEDELQLTRENGLYQQIVPLGDTEVLAEVARVGMVSLYYRTDAGEVGKATRTGAGWRFAELTDPALQQVTTDLFVSLRKQIRTGWFELAQPFPEDS